jgi:Zn-dependent peptidase ImmA (M78 family)/predicted secreted protein
VATRRELQEARRSGSLEAQRARRRIGLPLERRVDVFAVIEAEGVWLMFQPLRELYGFYRRVGEVSGIVVNSNHPTSLQRFTAAHEFGHHVLGHGYSLDEVRNVDGAKGVGEAEELEGILAARSSADVGDPLQEAAAQAFAGTFLMPIQVINRMLLDRGFDRDHPAVGPSDIYDISLELGASYEATITQLAVLEKIAWAETRRLRLPPIEIKTVVAGRRPDDARSDVWPVDATDSERDLPLRVGDSIVLRLPEVPSSGYAWRLERTQFSALELLDDELDASTDDEVYGGGVVRRVLLRATEPGVDDIVVGLRRPWEPESVGRVVVHAHVAGEPTGDAPSGLVRSQQLQRALVA